MKRLLWMLFGAGTAIVGYQIHSSIFWSLCDLVFAPITWVKWLVLISVSRASVVYVAVPLSNRTSA